MKNKYAIIVLLVLVFGIWGNFLFAQNKVGTTSFQFLKVTPDARSAAMGNSIPAMIQNSQAVFWNPAGLADISKFSVGVSQVDWLLDTNIFSVSAGYKFRNIGTFAIFAAHVDYGDFEVTEVPALGFNDDYTVFNPGLTGEVITPSAQYFGISFARSLTDRFNFGVTAKYVREDLVRADASKLAFDAGMTYKTGFKTLVLSAGLNHFGGDVRFFEQKEFQEYDEVKDTTYTITHTGESYPLPQTFTFGASTYLISSNNSSYVTMENQSLLFSYALTHPRDYAQQHNIGIEYGWMNHLFLRAGYKFNYDEESITYGVGLNIKNIVFDYAFDPFGELLEPVHRFSLEYSIK